MSSHPYLSVVMPVHNAGDYLLPAVNSILAQTFTDFELIIVDDHSSDQALHNLPVDPRIRLVANRGRGVIDAANTGLALARGEFIARMDADDIALRHRFERQLDLFQQQDGLGIVGSQVEFFSADEVGEGMRVYQQWLNRLCLPEDIERELFIECPVPHPSMMVRKSVYQMTAGYHDHGWPEDYDFILRAWQKGVKMAKVDEVLLHWREHTARHTYLHSRYSVKNFMRARAHYLANSSYNHRPVIVLGSGLNGKCLHDALEAEGVPVRGFIDVHPRKIGATVRGKPVWPVERIADMHGILFLSSIGLRGVHEQVRKLMSGYHRLEGQDFLLLC